MVNYFVVQAILRLITLVEEEQSILNKSNSPNQVNEIFDWNK